MAKNTSTPVAKKRGRPVGSKNKPKHNMPKTTSITPQSRALLEIVREDLTQRTGAVVTLRHTIQYLVESYINGSFK
jgi:hypothetical protein